MDINQDRIQALVGNSAETLNIELKNWVDPTTAEGQSKIVRAVLALRNRDGGELIDQANLMALARPVDAHKPFNLFRHAHALLSHPSHPGRRDDRQSLYWRSKRNLPRDFRRGRPAGVQVRSRCSKHGDSWATPGRPARSGQSTMPTSQ